MGGVPESVGAVIDSDQFETRKAYTIGVALVFGAAMLWSLNGSLIKILMECEDPPSGLAIAFYRSLFAGLFFVPFGCRKLHTLKRPAGRKGPWLRTSALACVVFYAMMTVSFVVANMKTEAANAIILQYTSTFWIFILSPLLLHERPRRKDIWILLVAVGGIAVIFAGEAGTDLIGLLIALVSGVTYALLTMMIRRLRDCDSAAVTVVNNLGSALLIVPFALLFGGLGVTPKVAAILLFMGVVQFGLPYYLYARGLVRIPAYHAALITMAEPILVPVWAYLAVGEEVPLMTFVGGGIILFALVCFILSGPARRRTEQRDEGG